MVPNQTNSTLERLKRQASFKDWNDEYSNKHNPFQLADLGFKFSFVSETPSIVCSGCNFQPKDLSVELDAISEHHLQFRADCVFNISEHAPSQVESAGKPKCIEVKPSKVPTNEKKFDYRLNYLKNLPRRKNANTQKDANSSKVVEFYLKKIIEKIIKRLEDMAGWMGSSHNPDNNTQDSASEVSDVSARSGQLRHMIVVRAESIDEEVALEACINSRDQADNSTENQNGSLQHDAAGPAFRETIKVQDRNVANAHLEQQFIARLLKMEYQKHHIREAIESRLSTKTEYISKTTRISQPEDSTQNSTNKSPDNPDGSPSYVSPVSPTHVSPVPPTHVSPAPPTHVSPVPPTYVSNVSSTPVSPTPVSPTHVSPVSPALDSSVSSTNVLQTDVSEVFKSTSIVDRPASFTATCNVSSSSANKGQASDAASISDNDSNIQHLTKESVIAALKDQPIDTDLARLFTEFEQSTHIRTCQVCFQNDITTVSLPCGHYMCCNTCTRSLTHCCMCRTLIRGTVKALTSRGKS